MHLGSTCPAIYRHCSLLPHILLSGFTCPHSLCIFFLTGSHGGHPITRSQSQLVVSTAVTADPNNLSACLDKEVRFYCENTFAKSTNRTYLAQRTAYFDFCGKIGIPPVPLSQVDLGRYIAFLSRCLTFSSIRQYINVVRLLHLEVGMSNPLESNWYVSSILKGVKRVKGNSVSQKLPITIDILRGILTRLNLCLSFDRCFWAACLVALFSFFRKSNLLVQSTQLFDPSRHLCSSDAQFTTQGVVLTVRWSKVIQFREKILKIPLPHIPNSVFCPSSSLLAMSLECPTLSSPTPLFRFKDGSKVTVLTQSAFTIKLRGCLSDLGYPASKFSGHSFRRGGASFGLQCGLPTDLIKLQGDWNSNAYERYLQPSFELRKQVASKLGAEARRIMSAKS